MKGQIRAIHAKAGLSKPTPKKKVIGRMESFGYRVDESEAARRAALIKAASVDGVDVVAKRLDFQAVVRKDATYKKDSKWIQKNPPKKGVKSARDIPAPSGA